MTDLYRKPNTKCQYLLRNFYFRLCGSTGLQLKLCCLIGCTGLPISEKTMVKENSENLDNALLYRNE